MPILLSTELHTNPDKDDLARAPDALPDGPNVAPSAHEHEAAQGVLPDANGKADNSQGAQGTQAGMQTTMRRHRAM